MNSEVREHPAGDGDLDLLALTKTKTPSPVVPERPSALEPAPRDCAPPSTLGHVYSVVCNYYEYAPKDQQRSGVR